MASTGDQVPTESSRVRVRFDHVTRRFRSQGRRNRGEEITAIKDIDFSIFSGEVVSVIGPSGCGKSTLLGLASGLDQPTEGQVYVDGMKVEKPNSHVAFMLQKDMLLPWRTIRENVELGQEIRGISAADRSARAIDLLQQYRLGEFVDHYPHQLSGGMRQRAALARTMALDPGILLMDEPFSALDAMTKMVLQKDLALTLCKEQKTALLITHDLTEAIILSDRVLVMSKRPGTVIKELKIDIPYRELPFERREHPKVVHYVRELIELLHIEEDDMLPA